MQHGGLHTFAFFTFFNNTMLKTLLMIVGEVIDNASSTNSILAWLGHRGWYLAVKVKMLDILS